MTHYHSDTTRKRSRTYAFALAGLIAVVLPALNSFASLVTTNIYIVDEADTVAEDVYVTSTSGTIDGTVDGDVTIFTGDLTISGTVTGNLTVFSSGTVRLTDSARVGGAVRGAAVNLSVSGSVADDVFVSGLSLIVEEAGSVGRDAMMFGGTGRIEGAVGRDLRGRMLRTVVDGEVARDVDVATQKLEIGPTAQVGGDVLYRSPVEADISSEAGVDSERITRLPAQSNFVYGIILMLANVVGFLGLVVAGLVAIGAFRGTSARATGAVLTHPIRTLVVGIFASLVLPVIIVLSAATLVGLPLAVLLGLVGIAMFIIGPVPALTAFGNRLLLRRGGLFGGFLMGAVVWRVGIWLIPVVGGFVYLLGLVWGVGGWILGAAATRRSDPVPVALVPESLIVRTDGVPADWEPPLAPDGGTSATDTMGPVVGESVASTQAGELRGDEAEPEAEQPEPEPSVPAAGDGVTRAEPTVEAMDHAVGSQEDVGDPAADREEEPPTGPPAPRGPAWGFVPKDVEVASSSEDLPADPGEEPGERRDDPDTWGLRGR